MSHDARAPPLIGTNTAHSPCVQGWPGADEGGVDP